MKMALSLQRITPTFSQGYWVLVSHPLAVKRSTEGWETDLDFAGLLSQPYEQVKAVESWITDNNLRSYQPTRKQLLDSIEMSILSDPPPWITQQWYCKQ